MYTFLAIAGSTVCVIYVPTGRKGEISMNLARLFETQQVLDDRIIKEKGLEGQDLLPMKILALQVELGELANEWRGFKFWSEDREPRTYALKLGKTSRENRYINPLLEEYVDCLHFILSIGLEIGINTDRNFGSYTVLEITKQFNFIFQDVSELEQGLFNDYGQELILESYDEMFYGFIGLSEMFGFTWSQIEQAYYAKNQTNHERQATGY